MYRIVLGLVFWVALCGAVIQDCGSRANTFISGSVDGCDAGSKFCIWIRGSDAKIKIKFNADQDIKKVNAVVTKSLVGLPLEMPFSSVPINACESSGLTCPLSENGGPYEYQASVPIKRSYPKQKVDVKWELKDDNEQTIVCVKIPVSIR